MPAIHITREPDHLGRRSVWLDGAQIGSCVVKSRRFFRRLRGDTSCRFYLGHSGLMWTFQNLDDMRARLPAQWTAYRQGGS